MQQSLLQLHYAIGFSGKMSRSVHFHPNSKEYICISGNQLIITNLNPTSTPQHFLKGHDNQITCVTISNNGKYIASGQQGDNSDVIIWDYDQKRIKYRLSEHDYEGRYVVCWNFFG
ncbi:WD40 repeat protein [Ichthyophthirius multifiliis]|uniref:WD40 repeat protein n=1 Tax=Ichthyophthirius multifiliis TaxID=5932 RepID=G0QY01_ICHMU|nr:WD40 repeat protein [Ichthyophthirius multifiliis]EGR29901.1 WD40 repeat protein [Ichthyophthirius multifiliis]|eukprot:XP_004031137.1 WD40 repeat protein [Ichthyophthirius multifiliis]